MNILVIDDEWPALYSGKALRIIHIFKRMSNEHRFHFLYLGDRPQKGTELFGEIFSSVNIVHTFLAGGTLWGRVLNLLLLKPGDYVRWRHSKEYSLTKSGIKKIIKENSIDLVHVFSNFTAQYVADIKGVKKMWDVGDSLYLYLSRKNKSGLSLSSLRARFYAHKIYRYEQEMIQKFDRTVFVSRIDAQVHHNLREKILFSPNGVDLEYYKSDSFGSDYPSLIFTGHMKFSPNVDAVLFFAKEIYPLVRKGFPSIKFYIVGAEPVTSIAALDGKNGIVVTGFVDDIRPYLGKATVFVSPMISGSGIKNKLLQAMAMRKPIVSTTLGAEAMSLTPGRDLILADAPVQFADALKQFLNNEEMRNKFAENGRRIVESTYSWETVAQQYDKWYRELTK